MTAFAPQTWEDYDTDYPLSAERMRHVETQYARAMEEFARLNSSATADDEHKYVFVMGVIRNDGGPGYFHLLEEGTNHRVVNIDSVTTAVDSIVVNYASAGGLTTGIFMAFPDEQLAKLGIICGCSVESDQTTISLYRSTRSISDYISWASGPGWTAANNKFTIDTTDFATLGILKLRHAGIFMGVETYNISLTPRGKDYYAVMSTASGATLDDYIKIEIYDRATNTKQTAGNANMKFMINQGGGTVPVNPQTLDTTAYPLSNIWLYGIMAKDNA